MTTDAIRSGHPGPPLAGNPKSTPPPPVDGGYARRIADGMAWNDFKVATPAVRANIAAGSLASGGRQDLAAGLDYLAFVGSRFGAKELRNTLEAMRAAGTLQGMLGAVAATSPTSEEGRTVRARLKDVFFAAHPDASATLPAAVQMVRQAVAGASGTVAPNDGRFAEQITKAVVYGTVSLETPRSRAMRVLEGLKSGGEEDLRGVLTYLKAIRTQFGEPALQGTLREFRKFGGVTKLMNAVLALDADARPEALKALREIIKAAVAR